MCVYVYTYIDATSITWLYLIIILKFGDGYYVIIVLCYGFFFFFCEYRVWFDWLVFMPRTLPSQKTNFLRNIKKKYKIGRVLFLCLSGYSCRQLYHEVIFWDNCLLEIFRKSRRIFGWFYFLNFILHKVFGALKIE